MLGSPALEAPVRAPFVAASTVLLAACLALAGAREDAARLVAEGQGFTREAMGADDPSAACEKALARFSEAQRLLQGELEAHPGDADLEVQVANVNAMIFWCHKMT